MSAMLLAPLSFGAAPAQPPDSIPASLFAEARDGLRATAGMRAIRIVLIASSAALFGAGLFNIAELFFATEDLGASGAGFAVLVTFFGIGFIAGSFAGAAGGAAPVLKRRYIVGLLFFACGLVATGLAGVFAVAVVTFGLAGFGNGLVLVYERLLIQSEVPDHLVGRVFGIKDALSAWAFAVAFLAGGALLEAIEPHQLILLAGGIGLVACGLSALALRGEWPGSGDGAGAPADRDLSSASIGGPPTVEAPARR
jgi:MFS family permease